MYLDRRTVKIVRDNTSPSISPAHTLQNVLTQIGFDPSKETLKRNHEYVSAIIGLICDTQAVLLKCVMHDQLIQDFGLVPASASPLSEVITQSTTPPRMATSR